MTARILLADDHAMVREALRMLLERAAGIDVVAEVANGLAVLDAVSQTQPDVVCMDINMPGMNGIEATRQLLAAHPGLKVIGLSAHADEERIAAMIAAGAVGYVVKSNAGTELLEMIRLNTMS